MTYCCDLIFENPMSFSVVNFHKKKNLKIAYAIINPICTALTLIFPQVTIISNRIEKM